MSLASRTEGKTYRIPSEASYRNRNSSQTRYTLLGIRRLYVADWLAEQVNASTSAISEVAPIEPVAAVSQIILTKLAAHIQ